jgi:transcriptional regulator with XRE-family HTH domain
MPRPKKPEPDKDFVGRLAELKASVGSQAELAKRAGLAPTTLQNYFEGGEPTRPMLVSLAEAGGVSISWLAAGRGGSSPENLPEGYFTAPFFDLRSAGWRVYPFFDKPADFVIFKNSWLRQATNMDLQLWAFEAEETVAPDVKAGDLVLMSPRYGARSTPGRPPWPERVEPGALYVIAHEAHVVLRYLTRSRSGKSVIAKAPGWKDMEIEETALDFQLLGLVLWRGGTV